MKNLWTTPRQVYNLPFSTFSLEITHHVSFPGHDALFGSVFLQTPSKSDSWNVTNEGNPFKDWVDDCFAVGWQSKISIYVSLEPNLDCHLSSRAVVNDADALLLDTSVWELGSRTKELQIQRSTVDYFSAFHNAWLSTLSIIYSLGFSSSALVAFIFCNTYPCWESSLFVTLHFWDASTRNVYA